jgi:hypothetical protein
MLNISVVCKERRKGRPNKRTVSRKDENNNLMFNRLENSMAAFLYNFCSKHFCPDKHLASCGPDAGRNALKSLCKASVILQF